MKAVRVFLDNSLEIVTALLRLVAIAGYLGMTPLLVAAGWGGDGAKRLLGVALVLLIVATGTGYLGFVQFGNEEWRRGKAEDRGA